MGDKYIDILVHIKHIINPTSNTTEDYFYILPSNGFISQINASIRIGDNNSSYIEHIFSKNINLHSA